MQRKITSQEDNLTGRQPQSNTNSKNENLKRRQQNLKMNFLTGTELDRVQPKASSYSLRMTCTVLEN